ncbi:MAG: deoxynucleoside kinase [Desulfitobacteriaceae bacterium]|nr:deoxynucleoside kinase [Desulfitobacteriaceae bacterium]MDD4400969.1 deoxynucleoside kinase [Desulfitobacteriaceae bacterium]
MLKGRLIVIEAGDGSGKATQTKLLFDKLVMQGKVQVRKVEFPNYQNKSSALIKMYLKGEFGADPNLVNPFVASTFYAIDRFISYEKEWKDFYLNGGIIIADRYTTSNMIHQAAKIADNQEYEEYLNWLWDLEFNKYKLPVPDCIFFLDMPPQYSIKLVNKRLNKFGDKTKDIHERNSEFLVSSYKNSLKVAEKYNWITINCLEGDKIRSVFDIHQDIYDIVKQRIFDSSEN